MSNSNECKCWELSKSFYRMPVVTCNIQIYSHLTQDWHEITQIIVDTGYDGDILLSSSLYEQLGFSLYEIPDELLSQAELLNKNRLVLKASISKAKWGSKSYQATIETFEDNAETIIGRGLLLKNSFHFFQDKQEFCIDEL